MVNVRKQTACAYIPLRQGFWYLAAVMDRHSRYVLAWRLSNTLEEIFCLEALDEAPSAKQPEILTAIRDPSSRPPLPRAD
jgi:transposase InsO family protein